MKKNRGEVIIYRPKKGKTRLDVSLKNETVWLSYKQMAKLFNKNVNTIIEHIGNVYNEKELTKKATARKFRVVQREKNREVERSIEFFNLDVIISVGYRVKSKQGTEFRIWATKKLREYIVKGLLINQKRLKQRRLSELEVAVRLIKNVSEDKQLESSEAKGLLEVITNYANSWLLLEKYDKDNLVIKRSKKKGKTISYEESTDVISVLKKKLLSKKQASDIFGQEYKGKIEGILNGLTQRFDGKELYSSVEEKAAHLLYFVIKDHPFVDGNKRIGAFLFILFLKKNNLLLNKKGEQKINDNSLVALALLIAQSDPKEKNVMIALITNLL